MNYEHATLLQLQCYKLCLLTQRLSSSGSRQWRRQLWGTGAHAPSIYNNFILVQFGANLTANYPNIV